VFSPFSYVQNYHSAWHKYQQDWRGPLSWDRSFRYHSPLLSHRKAPRELKKKIENHYTENVREKDSRPHWKNWRQVRFRSVRHILFEVHVGPVNCCSLHIEPSKYVFVAQWQVSLIHVRKWLPTHWEHGWLWPVNNSGIKSPSKRRHWSVVESNSNVC
jgi:hypothetical protein